MNQYRYTVHCQTGRELQPPSGYMADSKDAAAAEIGAMLDLEDGQRLTVWSAANPLESLVTTFP